MPSRSLSSGHAVRAELAPHRLSAAITAVRAPSDRGRAELIRDVVDAYRRLTGSVLRFVQRLAGERAPLVLAALPGTPTLNPLLTTLGELASAARFGRLRALRAAIDEARSAEQWRDAIFADASSHDAPALRKAAQSLERLDAAFVGLCVAHVLDLHAGATPAHASLDIAENAN